MQEVLDVELIALTEQLQRFDLVGELEVNPADLAHVRDALSELLPPCGEGFGTRFKPE